MSNAVESTETTPPLTMKTNNDNLQKEDIIKQPSRNINDSETSPKKKQSRNSTDFPSTPSQAPIQKSIQPSPPSSEQASKAIRDARSLNLALESALFMTLRREVAVPPVVYIGDDFMTSGELLNASNMSDVVCFRLAKNTDILNAVSYLCSTYKRLASKEATVTAAVKEDLVE